MKLDMVNDIQAVYRKVLNAMSRPGILQNLNEESGKNDIDINFFSVSFLIMLMVLDREVSFNIVSDKTEFVSKLLNEITYAQVKPVEEADYIFVLKDSCDKYLDETIEKSKIGDLIDPHKSATIVAEFESISNDERIEFSGPGIEEINRINVSGNNRWINSRNIKNQEYPFRSDSIFIDEKSNLVCIPRTTKVIEK